MCFIIARGDNIYIYLMKITKINDNYYDLEGLFEEAFLNYYISMESKRGSGNGF